MKVTTPVKGHTGTVAGVTFVDGVGETDDPNALAYFRRHGYVLDGKQKGSDTPTESDAAESEDDDTDDQSDDAEGDDVADEIDTSADERPSGRAGLETWTAYALAHGYSEDDLDGMGRNAIRDLFDEE